MKTPIAAALLVGLLIVTIGLIIWWTSLDADPVLSDGLPGMLHPIMQ